MDQLLPADTPDEVGVGYIAEIFGIATATVLHRIKTGALPAKPLPCGGGSITYIVRPADALLIWGHRLRRAQASTRAAKSEK